LSAQQLFSDCASIAELRIHSDCVAIAQQLRSECATIAQQLLRTDRKAIAL
jgi:hypothetical protein